MGESKRYIMNKDNGFHVMVNMYVIRYLYSHIEKVSTFMEEGGKRKKSIDFYQESVIGISRQRLTRMLQGMNFELSSEERQKLCKMFYLKEDYFLRNGLMIEVHLLKETDWKCFFNEEYGTLFEMNLPKKVQKENAEKVRNAMKYLVRKNVIVNEYEHDTPIYRIYHYFSTGTTYKEESRLTRFLKELSGLKLSDWEELETDIKELNQYRDMLTKHAHYVTVIAEYRNLKEQSEN